jgi:hypothetical protein
MREKISLSAKKKYKQSHHKHTERRIKQEPKPRKKNGQGRIEAGAHQAIASFSANVQQKRNRNQEKPFFTETKSERTTQRKRKQSPPFCKCPTKKETQIKKTQIFLQRRNLNA